MAVEVHAFQTATDPSRLASDWNDIAQPALNGAGALEATCWMAMTGPMTGSFSVSTRWDALGQWAAASAAMEARMSADGDLADLAGRYQTTQRIVAVDLHEAGAPNGPFLNASRYSITAAPAGLEHAASLTIAAGANGIRMYSILSGGEMTGHIVGSIFLDSFDALPDILASITADAQFVANAQAMGGHLESRTLLRRV